MTSTVFCLSSHSLNFCDFHKLCSFASIFYSPPLKKKLSKPPPKKHLLLLHPQKVGTAWIRQTLTAFYHAQGIWAAMHTRPLTWYCTTCKPQKFPPKHASRKHGKAGIEKPTSSICSPITLLNGRQRLRTEPRTYNQKALKVKPRILPLLWLPFLLLNTVTSNFYCGWIMILNNRWSF